ncbi:hypothetical protein MTO96_023217 [Rhipicephalus appendiculatus]
MRAAGLEVEARVGYMPRCLHQRRLSAPEVCGLRSLAFVLRRRGAHGKSLGMRGAVGEALVLLRFQQCRTEKPPTLFPKLLAAGEEVRRSLSRLV